MLAGSGVAGVAGKRLIQFRFPAVKAGDVVADLAQKAVNPAGPPTVASRLAALLSLMVMAAAQFADRHAVGKVFFADRRVVHQILLAIVDLSLQLFVTGIHPRSTAPQALL
ncbi:blaSHV-143_1_JQ341060 [Klebsiella pneumoniae]|nr:blaSHV-143_1_JQ341060 [Klebsiella pneumoniae]